MAAEIPLPQRAEDRIGERMSGDVGIRMAAQPMRMFDFDPTQDEPPTRRQRMKVEPLPYSRAHRNRFANVSMPYIDKHAAAVQAAIVMDFWRRPKFWGAFILVAWVLYVIYANFQLPPVEIHLLPKVILQFRVSAIIIMAAIFGAVAT